ncbi:MULTISPECIES: histidine phosphatase family protein [Clostridia]|uniref:histidine phosphatase family protein n=1 Tax=Clostridia TaxID=186801 RepID=UPI000EA1AC9B|nr:MULTISPECIES: histidine phosphatase family protein [Clostridia]NBJ70363.1 histidine phosphatase family protein [Roseburia sp. 1XD42-34]RKI76360.1 histidine phosphatase family protein [Clostridium sp. 1xD42-85]
MNKTIYIIRHCEAEGQAADASLTERGWMQAKELADFLSKRKIDRIISSPFLRAIQSIKPFADNKNLEIEREDRLMERVLSSTFFPDWLDKLKVTYYDLDLKYEGGESSNEAMNRIVSVVGDIIESNATHTVIVAHGGIISLLLHYYDQSFGFEQWKGLSNPDVYELNISDQAISYIRLWDNRSK